MPTRVLAGTVAVLCALVALILFVGSFHHGSLDRIGAGWGCWSASVICARRAWPDAD